jgi:hypothetical protein
MMEAASTSETSADIQLRTRQYIPEDSELHICRCENLVSYLFIYIWVSLGGFKNTMLSYRLHPTQNKNTYLHDMFRFIFK